MNPTKQYLTITALATACALSAIGTATAADEKPAAAEPRAQAGKQRDPEAMFKHLDGDADGKVTKEEFKKMGERMHKAGAGAKAGETAGRGDGGERIFAHLDTDKDGALTIEEFKKLAERHGEAGGGKRDPDKLKQMRERRQGAAASEAAKSTTEEKPKEPAK